MTPNRLWAEWRAWWIGLAVLLFLNGVAYVLGVRPLATRVSNAEERVRVIREQLTEARRVHQEVARQEEARAQTRTALEAFYRDVVPRGLDGAREMTYIRVAEMVGQHGLRYSRRRHVADDVDSDASLGRLRTTMVLEGEYEQIRQFIYALETAPELIVIDDIALSEGTDSVDPLTLTVGLSTYYRIDRPEGAT